MTIEIPIVAFVFVVIVSMIIGGGLAIFGFFIVARPGSELARSEHVHRDIENKVYSPLENALEERAEKGGWRIDLDR